VYSYASTNVWDDGYPSGGNFWSDYAGVDADGDGIGDTPYLIDDNNRDRYPLMGAFNTFDAGIWNGTAYNVDVVSNSIVSNFELNTAQRTISFNVASVEGVASFCRITIPNIIVQDLWQRNYTVLLNGEPWPYRNWTDNTSTYIYVNYTHPTHQITIIPELPSTAILTLLMLTTLTVTIPLKKKKTKPHLSLNFSLNVMRSSSLSSIPSLGKDAGGLHSKFRFELQNFLIDWKPTFA